MYGLAAQIASIIKFIAQFDEDVREKDPDLTDYGQAIYQFYVATVSYIGAVQRLLNGIETLRKIQLETTGDVATSTKKEEDSTVQQNIWEDSTAETPVEANGAGSVNQLICKVTADGAYGKFFWCIDHL